jgi:Xaa-Pro aminopeptidase
MGKNILHALREQIKSHKLAGFIVPSTDEFQNEYVPDHLNRLKFMTRFTGSNGVAIIGLKSCAFFTDGRYLLQAQKQLDTNFKILDIGAKDSCDWFDIGLNDGEELGYDPMLHSQDNLGYYEKLGAKYGFRMRAVTNLVDKIWQRNNRKAELAYQLALKYAGMSYGDKIKQVLTKMDNNATHMLITNPDAICWLLNIRGMDIDYTPFLLSFALLHKGGGVILFTDPGKITFKMHGVEVMELSKIDSVLESLRLDKTSYVQLDPRQAPIKFLHILDSKAILSSNPIEMLKACKNEVEVKGFKKAHEFDGLALIRFMHWLYKKTERVGEVEAAEKLLGFRELSKDFVYPSFSTISAYGSNASIIHYRPSKESSVKIGKNNFYLLDSGGQYYFGTTDVTRTMCLGKPNLQQKRLFTLVLKGHIRLAKARFPKGITGAHLDVLARAALWEKGLDFAHGTGHGVGHFLSVHEGPQRISKSLTGVVPLEAGMIVSNEPGYYEDGKFGIRIESLLLVKGSKLKGYLEFETLTLVPLQHDLIDYKMLDASELDWLQSYQQNVFARLKGKLSKLEVSWLKKYMGI